MVLKLMNSQFFFMLKSYKVLLTLVLNIIYSSQSKYKIISFLNLQSTMMNFVQFFHTVYFPLLLSFSSLSTLFLFFPTLQNRTGTSFRWGEAVFAAWHYSTCPQNIFSAVCWKLRGGDQDKGRRKKGLGHQMNFFIDNL